MSRILTRRWHDDIPEEGTRCLCPLMQEAISLSDLGCRARARMEIVLGQDSRKGSRRSGQRRNAQRKSRSRYSGRSKFVPLCERKTLFHTRRSDKPTGNRRDQNSLSKRASRAALPKRGPIAARERQGVQKAILEGTRNTLPLYLRLSTAL
jgi:hypothetical protein